MSGYKTQEQIQRAERALVGPYIVGGVLQAMAYGVLIAQYWWIVAKAKQRPSWRLHTFLALLAMFNSAQCASTIALMWQVVMDFAAVAVTRKTFSPPSTVVMIVFYNLIQCSTNCWFARRCYIATGRSLRVFALLFVLVGALLVVSSAAIVLNIWVFARGSSYIVTRNWLAAAITINAVAELVIAVILIVRITRDELIHYRALVNRIVVLSMTTSSLTAAIGVAQAIVLLTTWQRSSAYVAMSFVLPRLSTICVYAAVMAKDHFHQKLHEQNDAEPTCDKITAISNCSTDRTLTVTCAADVFPDSNMNFRRPSLEARRLPSFAAHECAAASPNKDVP